MTLTLPRQKQFDLRPPDRRPLDLRRPLLSIETFRSLTDELSEDDILNEIIDGRIKWAFNLAGAGASRSYVRIWNRSVLGWFDREFQQTDDLSEVINHILPARSLVTRALTAREVIRACNVTSSHIYNLIRDGLLKESPGSSIHRGPSGGAIVTRASAVQFLTTRRMA